MTVYDFFSRQQEAYEAHVFERHGHTDEAHKILILHNQWWSSNLRMTLKVMCDTGRPSNDCLVARARM